MRFLKYLFYPFWRVRQDMRESREDFKAAIEAARQAKRNMVRGATTEAERAALPADAGERFAFLAEKNGFGKREVADQRNAAHIGKVFALIGIVVMLTSAVLTVFYAKGFLILMSLPITLSGCVFFSVLALRYALYQTQLEDRRLYSLREFISREDLFHRLLK